MKTRTILLLAALCLSAGLILWKAPGAAQAGSDSNNAGWLGQWNLSCTTDPIVTSFLNQGPGSLRQAVADACPGSTITFLSAGTISLSTGQIIIEKNLTLQGPGADKLTVQNTAARSPTSRVFLVGSGATVTLAGLTITGGYLYPIDPNDPNEPSRLGGGIYNRGNLTVRSAIIRNNVAGLAPAFGGGIYNGSRATLTVTDSTIEGNSASSRGGGIHNGSGTMNIIDSTILNNGAWFEGGGISTAGFAQANVGTVTITNSTIFHNITSDDFYSLGSGGAGIFSDNAIVSLTNSTVSYNIDRSGQSTPGGGGIRAVWYSILNLTNTTVTDNIIRTKCDSGQQQCGTGIGSGIYSSLSTVNSRNSIIAGNIANPPNDIYGGVNSQGYNLIGSQRGSPITGNTTGNIVGISNPRLAPLGFYGGKTMTNALLSNSPAVNAGDPTLTTPDQRGAGRVGTPDIGAFELNNAANGGSFVAQLPAGTSEIPYNYTFIPFRGPYTYDPFIPPFKNAFTYSLTGGALPAGISVATNSTDVSIAGGTTQTGIFNFSVTATDGTNSNVTDYRLQIIEPRNGYHESADCSSISGWAWDSRYPNTPINVDIYADGNLVATVSANQFRQDLLNAGIGNGVHGFNITTPPGLKDGQAHEIRVRYAGTSIDLGTTPKSIICSAPPPTPTPTPTATPTPTPTPVPTPNYGGYHEVADCNQISGWAWDSQQPNTPISVDIYADGNLLATVSADQFRQDLLNAGIGNGAHGFNITTPPGLKDGQAHEIRVRYAGTSIDLGTTPKSIICSAPPPPPSPTPTPNYGGYHESADCNQISGWAWDPRQPNTPINVDIYADGNLLATVLADQFRQDLLDAGIGNGAHAFSLATPASLKNGQPREIRVRYAGTSIDLSATPKSITCSAPTPTPTATPTPTPTPTATPTPVPTPDYGGYHEAADCSSIGGWAWDAQQPNTLINVDIYADGSLLATVSADQFRQDLLDAGKGNGAHAFSLATPASLKDGQPHEIRVRYAGTNIDLGTTPKSITCSAPTPTPTPTVSVAGSLTYGTTPAAQTAKPVSGVLLSASGASSTSASSDSSGAYLLGNLLSGGSYTVTPSKSGDVNSISSFDASLVSRYAANPQGNPLTANQLIAADASGNGQVTSFDASFIARTAAAIANNGIAGQWRFVPASKSYTNLTANQTGENYTAILIGEVSGNWTPPSGGNAAAPNLSSAEQKQADLAEEQMYQENLNLFGLEQPAYKNWLMPLFSGGVTAVSDEWLSLTAAGIAVSLPSNASTSNGSVAVIPVTVGDTTNQGIFSFDFTVSFDPNVLTPASSSFDTTGTLAGAAGFTITANTNVPGQITISGFGTQPLSGAGTLINLRFNVVGTANTATGSTSLNFGSFVFNEGDPQAMTTNGQFTVAGPTAAAVSVSGRVTSGKGRGVARARVSFTDAAGNRRTAITNPFGYYRFEAVDVGITYVFEARAKSLEFAPQIVYLTEEMTNLNFTAVAGRQSP